MHTLQLEQKTVEDDIPDTKGISDAERQVNFSSVAAYAQFPHIH
jgi:SAM-dependent MidA family methyltransferase